MSIIPHFDNGSIVELTDILSAERRARWVVMNKIVDGDYAGYYVIRDELTMKIELKVFATGLNLVTS